MRFLITTLFMSLALKVSAADPTAEQWKAPNGIDIPYRLAVPEKVEPGKTYPLILFLHGAGERGDDNTKHLKHGIRPILENAAKLGEPCFLIAPQCPAELWWADLDDKKLRLKDATAPNPRLEAVLALVDDFSKSHPVDLKRLYITGISMGGFGTWFILGQHPDKFAAALPICGGGDPAPEIVSKFKDVPVWTFHGDKDPTVPVAATLDLVAALEKAGGKPKLTVYPGVQHDSWTQTYADPEPLRWLLSQRKK
ncbi:MAG TPA: prolyl oligopeptidase family serine peptidase [Luteolibacter sp.]|nr:prolyl oligopeptidase family serine peptidase [Luteolibacter sp.]